MKSILSVFAMVIVIVIGAAQAHAANVTINHVYCQGGQLGYGTVALTFTGLQTFNISGMNAAGIPFSQQAEITKITEREGDLVFSLRSFVTGAEFELVLVIGTTKGTVSQKGQRDTLQLTCSSLIQKI